MQLLKYVVREVSLAIMLALVSLIVAEDMEQIAPICERYKFPLTEVKIDSQGLRLKV